MKRPPLFPSIPVSLIGIPADGGRPRLRGLIVIAQGRCKGAYSDAAVQERDSLR